MAREHVFLSGSDGLEWQPFPGGKPGEWIKVLSRDEETGAYTALIKFERGWKDDRSVYHRCGEEVFIVRGRFKVGDRIMGEGAYAYRPPYTLHGAAEVLEETIMYISFDGDGGFYTDAGYTYVE
jgi:ChrR-like protein with cupin domain